MLKLLKATLFALTVTQPLYAQNAERGNASNLDIAILQLVASQNGFKLKVDGKWGPRTAAGLTKFSEKFMLPHNATQMLQELNSRKLSGVYYFSSGQYLEEIKKMAAYDLMDPDSAKIRNVFTDGTYICGEINAKNAFGAYSGYRPFELFVFPTPLSSYYNAAIKQELIKSDRTNKRSERVAKNEAAVDEVLDKQTEQIELQSAGREYVNSWSRETLVIFDENDSIISKAIFMSNCFFAANTLSENQIEGMRGVAKMFAE